MIELNRTHEGFSLAFEVLCSLSPAETRMSDLVKDLGLKNQKELHEHLVWLKHQGYGVEAHNNGLCGRIVLINRYSWQTTRLHAQLYWQKVNKPQKTAA